MLLEYLIEGQVSGGKNNIGITRSGKRYPTSKAFIRWRKHALNQLLSQKQLLKQAMPINHPVSVCVEYYTDSKRRRDTPAILDAIWHVLEKSEIITDDFFLAGFNQECLYKHILLDKGTDIKPHVRILLYVSKEN